LGKKRTIFKFVGGQNFFRKSLGNKYKMITEEQYGLGVVKVKGRLYYLLSVQNNRAFRRNVGTAAAGALIGGMITGGTGGQIVGGALGGRRKDDSYYTLEFMEIDSHQRFIMDVLPVKRLKDLQQMRTVHPDKLDSESEAFSSLPSQPPKKLLLAARRSIIELYDENNVKLWHIEKAINRSRRLENFYAAVSEEGLEVFQFTKDQRLIPFQDIKWSEWTDVAVDQFFLKTIYTFNRETGEEEVIVFGDTKGKVESSIRKNTDLQVHVRPRSWYRKIIGFRSGKKMNMAIAGIIYIIFIIALFTPNTSPENTSNETLPAESNSTITTSEAKTPEPVADVIPERNEVDKIVGKKSETPAVKKSDGLTIKDQAAYYTEKLLPTIDDVIADYDQNWTDYWAPTFRDLSTGNTDIYSAYDNLSSLEGNYEYLGTAINSLEIDKSKLNPENVKILEEMAYGMHSILGKEGVQQLKKCSTTWITLLLILNQLKIKSAKQIDQCLLH